MVAAYNRTYGDLMVGEVGPDLTASSIRWTFVDGVPTATASVEGDLLGPREGRTAPGREVGWYTDIVVGPASEAWVAYHDRSSQSLRFASGRGRFEHHLVDGDGEAGLYGRLAVNNQGRALLIYLAHRAGPPDRRFAVLRLATAQVDRPRRPSDWTRRDLIVTDLASASCEDRCRPDELCLRDMTECVRPDRPPRCDPACNRNSACIRGACQTIRTRSEVIRPPSVEGLRPGVAVTRDGSVLVSYHDRPRERLVLLRLSDGGFGLIEAVPVAGRGGLVDLGDTIGQFHALAVDDGGVAHLLFQNLDRASVRYVTVTRDNAVQRDETVETGALLGADPVLSLGTGSTWAAYQDAHRASVRLASKPPGGAWQIQPSPAELGSGFYLDLVARGQGFLGVSYRFDLAGPQSSSGLVFFEAP